MIFYFSGTGNTRWAAIQIGAATQERLINIADYSDYLSADKDIEPFALKEGERLGFVFPVHGWRVPRLVRSFISRLRLKTCGEEGSPDSKPFCYAVCTAGDSIGKTIDTLTSARCTEYFYLAFTKICPVAVDCFQIPFFFLWDSIRINVQFC